VTECPWCADPNAEDWADTLCKAHEAEYLGLSVAGLEHMYAEQAKDEFWAYH
jgi:hypothetical protein